MSQQRDELAMAVLFPSEYLKADDLQGREVTVKIAGVSKEKVPMSNGQKELKTIVRLEGTPKKILFNKTNGWACSLLLSPNLAAPSGRDWIGKRVVLCADIDSFGKEDVAAIRVVGSPDAAPDRAAEFARLWKGQRKGGDLARRLKRAVAVMGARGTAPAVEREPGEDG